MSRHDILFVLGRVFGWRAKVKPQIIDRVDPVLAVIVGGGRDAPVSLLVAPLRADMKEKAVLGFGLVMRHGCTSRPL